MNNNVLKLQQKINEIADEQIGAEELEKIIEKVLTKEEKTLFNRGELSSIPCLLYAFERLDQTGFFYLVSTYEDRQAMVDNGAMTNEDVLAIEQEMKKFTILNKEW